MELARLTGVGSMLFAPLTMTIGTILVHASQSLALFGQFVMVCIFLRKRICTLGCVRCDIFRLLSLDPCSPSGVAVCKAANSTCVPDYSNWNATCACRPGYGPAFPNCTGLFTNGVDNSN